MAYRDLFTSSLEHQYAVYDPTPGKSFDSKMPTIRDPDAALYFKTEDGKMIVGGWEKSFSEV